MSDYNDLSLRISNFNSLKELDNDGNKKISVAELKKLDFNNDGKIDDQEFGVAGINDPVVKNEIQKKLTGVSDPSKTVFSFVELNSKIKGLEVKKEKLIKETKEFVSNELSGANPRAIINQLVDDDDNGVITLGELNKIDKEKFVHLAQDAKEDGLDKKIDGIEAKLKKIEGADLNTPIIEFNKDSDFKSYWKYRGDCPSGEIDKLEKKDKAYKELDEKVTKLELKPNKTEKETDELKDLKEKLTHNTSKINDVRSELLKKTANNPELKDLLTTLEYSKTLTFVDLQALNRISNKLPTEKISEITATVKNFLTDSKGKFNFSQKMQIASDIFHDIAYPENIDQKSKGTCAATAIQMKLALRDPIKYTKLCTSLANDEHFKLDNNKTIKHNKTYTTDKEDDRSLSCKIVQNSLMDFAHSQNPKEFSYVQKGTRIFYDSRLSVDSAQGKSMQDTLKDVAKKINGLKNATVEQLESLGDGLDDKESLALEKALFNKVHGFFDIKDKKDKAVVIKSINRDLENNRPVVIGFEGHAVLLHSLENNHGKSKYVIDSWSGQYEMNEDQLKKVLDSTFVSELIKK